MWRTDSLEKTLILGKTEGRRRGWQRVTWLGGITNIMYMSLSELQELVMDREAGMLQSTGSQRVRHDWVTELTEVHETETFMVRSVPFYKETKDILLSTTWGHCKKQAIYWPGRGTLLGTTYLGTWILDFSVSRTVRNKCLLLQQHNSWYSMIVAWED